MKITTILEEIELLEMTRKELEWMGGRLNSLLANNGYKLVITRHSGIDRLMNDPSRSDISPDEIIQTIQKLLDNKKFLEYKENKHNFEGKVTNHSINLHIIFFVDNRSNQFRLITLMKNDKFLSDNKPTKPFNVRTHELGN